MLQKSCVDLLSGREEIQNFAEANFCDSAKSVTANPREN